MLGHITAAEEGDFVTDYPSTLYSQSFAFGNYKYPENVIAACSKHVFCRHAVLFFHVSGCCPAKQ